MRLLIMGPPGAGKGTQAKRIAEHYRIPAISTGDIFRAMKHADTPLARQVRAIMESGGYVSDEITNEIVQDRLAQGDCATGFLLDGYPRTLQQVQTLDDYLAETERPLDAVISLLADIDEVVAGCSSGLRSTAAPTTTRKPSGFACRSTPSRPSRCLASTVREACWSRSMASARSTKYRSESLLPWMLTAAAEPPSCWSLSRVQAGSVPDAVLGRRLTSPAAPSTVISWPVSILCVA